MKLIARHVFLLVVFISGASFCVAQSNKSVDEPSPRTAEEANPASWKEYSSTEGRFSVLFPGTPNVETQTINAGGDQLKMYMHSLRTFAVYGVLYADYPIHVNDANRAKQVLDSMVKVAVEEGKAELLNVVDISVGGHPGRLLRERLPGGNILTLKMILVGSRMYQVIFNMPEVETTPDQRKAYEQFASKFLDSFKLTGQTATREVDSYLAKEKALGKAAENSQGAIVEGGVLEGRAISLPQPPYPAIAKAVRASGMVTIKVIVDEEGKVVAAQAESGHPLLLAAALQAARQARFSPTMLNGKPVKVSGVINYNFALK